MSLNLSMSIWSAQESAQSFRQAASRHIDIQHSWCWLGASSLNTTLFTVDVSCKKCTLSCIAIISLHYTTVSRNINKRGQALPSGQFDIWHPWSETLASSYIRQMVAGGRVKMKGSGRDLTSAQSSDHGVERDPATKARRSRHWRRQHGRITSNLG